MLDKCLHEHNSHAIETVMFCLRFKEIRHFYIIIVVFSKGVLSKKKKKENTEHSFLLFHTYTLQGGVHINFNVMVLA